MLLGLPVMTCELAVGRGSQRSIASSFDTLERKAINLVFGDIAKGYAVAIHRNTTILRDPYTATPKVRFYANMRVGGRPWDKDAVVLLSTVKAEG